jgi:hypothetical protein
VLRRLDSRSSQRDQADRRAAAGEATNEVGCAVADGGHHSQKDSDGHVSILAAMQSGLKVHLDPAEPDHFRAMG